MKTLTPKNRRYDYKNFLNKSLTGAINAGERLLCVLWASPSLPFRVFYMSKDPAFLFYPGDWLGGTQWMTMEQKGCYISLLVLQFDCYEFTEAQAKQVLSICFDVAWPMLMQKFRKEGDFFHNERLREEMIRRKKFTESRRVNGLSQKKARSTSEAFDEASAKHMEDENEATIKAKSIIEDKEQKKSFSESLIYPGLRKTQ